MAYDLLAKHDGVSPCGRCAGDAERAYLERVDGRVPIWRSVRLRRSCRGCGWTTYVPVDRLVRATLPRTPGIAWRIAVTWLLMIGVIAGAIGITPWLQHRERERARSPEIGDRWDIDTARWRRQTQDASFDPHHSQGLVRVIAVTATEVTTSSGALARDAIPVLLERGAIEAITRDGDDDGGPILWIALAAYVAAIVLHGASSRRYLTRRERLAP